MVGRQYWPNESPLMHHHNIEDNENPSEAVIRAIEILTDTPMLQLDPLAESIDPEALDNLLTEDEDTQVTFTYCDFEITVNGEKIKITPKIRGS